MDFLTFSMLPILTFLIGLSGIFLNSKNIILVLVSIELMLLSVNFVFLVGSVYLDDRMGQLFALLVLAVAAAESSMGMAILVVYYSVKGTISIEFIKLLQG